MNNTSFRRIWDIIYPVFLYVVLSDCVYTLLCLAMAGSGYSDMVLQIATAIISFPPICYLYRCDQKAGVTAKEKPRKESEERLEFPENRKILDRIVRIIFICLAAACLSIALNNLISLTNLQEKSKAYQRVTASFFSSTLFTELFGTSVVTPILEETLYRGLVYRRLRQNQGVFCSILVSAVIFGAIHFNLVQFLYAGIIGLFLALVFETEGKLYVPVLAHAAANAISVLRAETGFLSWMTADWDFFLPASFILLVTALVIIWYIANSSYLKNNFIK